MKERNRQTKKKERKKERKKEKRKYLVQKPSAKEKRGI